MKISARNQLEGVITALVCGPVNAEVTLGLPGGDCLVAVVTTRSVWSLGLAVGGHATAIVKAPWVVVTAGDGGFTSGDGGPRFPVRNQLGGVVTAVKSGAIHAEVAITLPGGAMVHAVITRDAVAALGLVPGAPACAVIKASHVVLAV
jgi:molybdate transport system regulatory protein